MRPWHAPEIDEYTYLFADGTSCTVNLGEDGVRKKDLLRLQQMDHGEAVREKLREAHVDFSFLNAQMDYERYPGDLRDSPLDMIPDENADIWDQLYGEKEGDWAREVLEEAMRYLTVRQRNLIREMYGMQMTPAALGRKYQVTETAIRNRREKILKRLRKLIAWEREDDGAERENG